ncbi:MAG TPA: FAD-dependent oxidoreductase [Thermomicrobiales bacterium]
MGTMMDRAGVDVVIVGGGLAGLTAAAYVARAGRSVTLYERSRELGGRARTSERDGYTLNFGPHALYRGGTAAPILRELGVRWHGKAPLQAGYGFADGRLQPLPTGLRSFLTTTLLSAGAKRELLTLLPRLFRLDTLALREVTLRRWLDRTIRHEELRQLVLMLVRTTTYAADCDRMSAGAALAQTKLGLVGNVDYIDGGWRVLVDGLRDAAQAAGVRIVADTRVVEVRREVGTGAVRGVRLADGAVIEAAAVVIAADPATAAGLVGGAAGGALADWAARAIPVEMACLDLGLSALPDPAANLAFGLDRPLYLSVHSAVARLAPAGGAVIHVGKYLRGDEPTEPEADLRELEGLLDLVQPGWRERVAARIFLPRMTVTNALVTAEGGGLAGRPGPAVPGFPGLYVAGDWVGPTGMLSDAALASAKLAAETILATASARSAELLPA